MQFYLKRVSSAINHFVHWVVDDIDAQYLSQIVYQIMEMFDSETSKIEYHLCYSSLNCSSRLLCCLRMFILRVYADRQWENQIINLWNAMNQILTPVSISPRQLNKFESLIFPISTGTCKSKSKAGFKFLAQISRCTSEKQIRFCPDLGTNFKIAWDMNNSSRSTSHSF